jgi:methylmalonyl-CoA mutase N-terminal domain/subunit
VSGFKLKKISLEELTTARFDIEKAMLDLVNKIESQGGMMEVIRSGWLKKEIIRSAYLKQKALEDGRQVRVGLNKFCVDEETIF